MIPLRLIPYSEHEPSLNMALDWVLFRETIENGLPFLRFYGFYPPGVTIGRFQKGIPDGLEGYPCARRPTGGRAVLHDGDLVFSLSGWHNSGLFAGSVSETYRATAEILAEAAARLGLAVEVEEGRSQAYDRSGLCFRATSRYEIKLMGKKVIGIAQAREKGAFLEQGSIYLPVDKNAYMAEIKRGFSERGFLLEEKGITQQEFERAKLAQKEFEIT
ncbi:MAG: hypothetical protein ABIN54_10275 [candidate division WOR-3 bacterium]